MKPNLIPVMSSVQLRDRDGAEVYIDLRAFEQDGLCHLFMSDRNGAALVARNGGVFITQLIERFALNSEATQFYRHVYSPASGSLFGRFELNWQAQVLAGYTFRMLSPIDEGLAVAQLLKTAEPIVFKYSQMKNLG